MAIVDGIRSSADGEQTENPRDIGARSAEIEIKDQDILAIATE
jgi:hypothetical protein